MQHGEVVAYGLGQVKDHEKNYPANDLELVVVTFASNIRRHYLYGEEFEVSIDHKSLKIFAF